MLKLCKLPYKVLCFVLTITTGCGQSYQPVVYEQNTPTVQEFAFPRTVMGATNMTREKFSTSVVGAAPIAFTGEVTASLPKRPGHLRMKKQAGSNLVTHRTGRVTFDAGEHQDAFRFRSELKAPVAPGIYMVEVTCGDALLALGEVVVTANKNR